MCIRDSPAGEDINVGIKVDASLVNTYNARLGANYTMLDAKHYKLSAGQTVIPQGEVSSKPVTIDFSGLTDLEIDAGYLLPITIDKVSGGMGTLGGSKTCLLYTSYYGTTSGTGCRRCRGYHGQCR